MTNPTATTSKRQAAINRAMDKAHDQARAGVRPILTETSFDGSAIHETWNVASRSGRGVYAVSLTRTADAIWTTCTCAAAASGSLCWHRAAVRLSTVDAIPFVNEAGYKFRPRQQPAMAAD